MSDNASAIVAAWAERFGYTFGGASAAYFYAGRPDIGWLHAAIVIFLLLVSGFSRAHVPAARAAEAERG